MILSGIEDRDEKTDDAFCLYAVGRVCRGRRVCSRRRVATDKEGAGEVTDGGYDYGEMISTVPKAVIGGLVTEDLIYISWVRLMGDKEEELPA